MVRRDYNNEFYEDIVRFYFFKRKMQSLNIPLTFHMLQQNALQQNALWP